MERRLTLIALFAALISTLSWLPKLDLAFGVPVTAQTLGIMLAGTVLGKRDGTLAVLLYLLLGAIGLPVFAGGMGGIGAFYGPTGGFLIGFPVAAFVTGWITEKLPLGIGFSAFIGSAIGGIAALYVFGIAGLAYVLSKSLWEAALICLPFLIGDFLKAILAGLLTRSLFQLRPGIVRSRA